MTAFPKSILTIVTMTTLTTIFDTEADDEFIWQVCRMCELEGMNELQKPSLYPRQHRELLRAIVAARTGISYYRIDLKALDAAYSIAFPNSTPININKKKRVAVLQLKK